MRGMVTSRIVNGDGADGLGEGGVFIRLSHHGLLRNIFLERPANGLLSWLNNLIPIGVVLERL